VLTGRSSPGVLEVAETGQRVGDGNVGEDGVSVALRGELLVEQITGGTDAALVVVSVLVERDRPRPLDHEILGILIIDALTTASQAGSGRRVQDRSGVHVGLTSRVDRRGDNGLSRGQARPPRGARHRTPHPLGLAVRRPHQILMC
jgi:hypothetical protein